VHVTDAGQPGAFREDAMFRGISVDGTHVFFDTFEEILASDDETGGAALDVYEVFGGQTFHVSIGSNALRSATFVGASEDGSRVFFATNESFDSVTEQTSQVSPGNGAFGVSFGGISPDGGHVFFDTTERLAASDIDDGRDVYGAAVVMGLPDLIFADGFESSA